MQHSKQWWTDWRSQLYLHHRCRRTGYHRIDCCHGSGSHPPLVQTGTAEDQEDLRGPEECDSDDVSSGAPGTVRDHDRELLQHAVLRYGKGSGIL